MQNQRFQRTLNQLFDLKIFVPPPLPTDDIIISDIFLYFFGQKCPLLLAFESTFIEHFGLYVFLIYLTDII
jgi:hypothetical protein